MLLLLLLLKYSKYASKKSPKTETNIWCRNSHANVQPHGNAYFSPNFTSK